MYYQLFLLFISFCAYAADVAPTDAPETPVHITYQNIEGVGSIVYTRGDITITFPAEALTKSTVLHDIVTNCSDAKEDKEQAFIEAARWFFGNIADNDISLVAKLLQQVPEPFQEDITLSDGRSIHYKRAFKSKFRKNAGLPETDRTIISHEREKYKRAKTFIQETYQPLFDKFSTEQIIQLLALYNQFDIKSLYTPLVKHVAKHCGLWSYITNDDISHDIVQKIDFDSLRDLQDFLYTQRRYKTFDLPRKNNNTEGWYNNLTTESKQIIKQHLFKNHIIRINPINPDEILVYDYREYNKTYLVINQATHEYYTFQAPWNNSEGKYSPDGKTIKLSAHSSFNNAYKDIYIFDIESKKALFEGNGKANGSNTTVYGNTPSDSQYRFHFLDTQKTCTPWPEPRRYMKFSPDKQTLTTKNDAKTIAFYNIQDLLKDSSCDPIPLKVLKSLENAKISYNADGSEFLIIHGFRNVTLYDGKTLKLIGTLPAIKKGVIHKARYSNDNKKIIIKDSDSTSNIAYRRINLRQLPLDYIRVLANAFQRKWKRGWDYLIDNEEQLIKFHTMVPDLLIDGRFLTCHDTIQEQFKNIIKESLENTIGTDAQYFDTANASKETLKLWYKAQQHWQEYNKNHYKLKDFEQILFLNSKFPLEVALRLFYFNCLSCDKQALRDLAFTNIQNLKLPLAQSSITTLVNSYGTYHLPYFILALKHFQSNNKPYVIDYKYAHMFLDIKEKAVDKLPILNQLFETHFDYSLIPLNIYGSRISTALYSFKPAQVELSFAEFDAAIYDILNKFDKPTFQFIYNASTLAWKNKNPHPLETEEDLDHCFAFNQELNKKQHTPIAQEVRSHNLFALSKKAPVGIREKYLRKVYWRLRSQQIIKQDHLPLLHDLTIDQLNMLFRASYQPYQLKKEDLDTYYQLPDACKTEKLFGQNIINRARADKLRELESTRPSRLAESFANIAYNVKKLMRN